MSIGRAAPVNLLDDDKVNEEPFLIRSGSYRDRSARPRPSESGLARFVLSKQTDPRRQQKPQQLRALSRLRFRPAPYVVFGLPDTKPATVRVFAFKFPRAACGIEGGACMMALAISEAVRGPSMNHDREER
jgi:hypothetical protein